MSGEVGTEVRYLGDVQRLVMNAGDLLVLKLDRHLPRVEMEGLAAHVSRIVGNGVKVLVLVPGIDLGVLSRGGAGVNHACDVHQGQPLENCLRCFANHPLIGELRAVREANEEQGASEHQTRVTVALGRAIVALAAAAATGSESLG